MKWLFWKECRQNRPILIALLAILIVPHLFGLISVWDTMRQLDHAENAWKKDMLVAGIYSFGLSQLALALIGGNAIAGERADRSAEFQAYLPLARKKILAAKLLLALAIAAVVWLTNPPLVFGLLTSVGKGVFRDADAAGWVMINIAITGLLFFGVAWLFASLFSSPTFATIAGLIAPLIIWSLILFALYLAYRDQWHMETGRIAEVSYWSASLTLAPLCFGLGTWQYLRRVEP